MSAPSSGRSAAARAGATRPAGRPARPARQPLTVVPERSRPVPGRTFVVLLLTVLGAGLVGLLVLNTAMQRSAFALDSLEQRADALDVRRQVLDLRVDRLQSPEVLWQRATELGMVPMTHAAFLQLSDGMVIGDPTPAVAGTGSQLVVEQFGPHAAPPVPPAPPAGEGQQEQGQQEQGQQEQGQHEQQGQGQGQQSEPGQQNQPGQRGAGQDQQR